MKRLLFTLILLVAPLHAQETRIAVAGLVHSHVWGHLRTMLSGDPAKLVWIAETKPDLIAEAKKLGADDALFVADYRAALVANKPDIVWAFVENNRHLEIVQACAPLGVHVIFEKPLASTLFDAREIARLARHHSVQVMTNYQMAWWPSNYTAKKQVDAGAVGQLWRLRGIVGHGGPGSRGPRSRHFFAWLTDPVQNGGGALVDFGCYNALWSLWYLGRPERVYAHVNQLRPETFPKVEDNSTLLLSYPSGVGIFEGSWDLPRGFQDLEIFGLEASLYVTRNGVEFRKGRRGLTQAVELDPLPLESAEPITHMIHAIRNQAPLSPLVALDINVGVVEILEAAKESVRSGQAVTLSEAR